MQKMNLILSAEVKNKRKQERKIDATIEDKKAINEKNKYY